MSARYKGIDVPDNTPYANDRLSRKSCGEAMNILVDDCAEEGGVIALNGAWGTGKTTFIRMWSQALHNAGYPVICYNAWKTDYISDPLIALYGALSSCVLFSKNQEVKDELKSLAKKLYWGTVYAANQAVKAVASFDTKEVIGQTKKSAEDWFDIQLENLDSETSPVNAFKQKLETLIDSNDSGHPIVFIIDELDRCSPTYAVRLL